MYHAALIDWRTGSLMAAAAALLLAGFVLQLHKWGIRPWEAMARLRLRPWFDRLFAIGFVAGIVQCAVPKGTNGVGRGRLMALMRSPAPAVTPTAVDANGFSIPANFPVITNLCLWGIEPGTNSVALGIAWPDGTSFTNGCIDIFGNWRLSTNGWLRLAQLDVSRISSNAVVEFAYADLPTNAMRSAAFYRLASQDDSDGDGLSDKVEQWVLGTDPEKPDTDEDGLGDGDELELECSPALADSDSDGIPDGDEVGYIAKSPRFEWYDTTGWATVYGVEQGGGLGGYWPAYAMCTLSNGPFILGIGLTGSMCFEKGCVFLYSPGSGGTWIFPECVYPLDVDYYKMGDIVVAPYWCNSSLVCGDPTSYIRTGIVSSNDCFVAEYHNVRLSSSSDERMTYQVIVPGGTGNVVRVSYHSSDIWIDGANAVVGVQNKRITTTNGCYNLTWNFSERGPILPLTTIEYHLGYGTNPSNGDTDGDGLDDAFEIAVSHGDPLSADGDGDGLSDSLEYAIGTNPRSSDTDGDNLPDKWEYDGHLDPRSAIGEDGWSGDPDGDGLENGREKSLGTSPTNDDTDGDDLDDGLEVSIGTSPLLADSDYDGLSDSQERAIGTTPTEPDTDGDGLNDGWEWHMNSAAQDVGSTIVFSPLVNNSDDSDPANDYSADPDGDELTNGRECDLGTNPVVADTDGDNVDDGAEIGQNSDPNDASDSGAANSRALLPFYFGDHSESHSEKYCLKLTPVAGSGLGPTPRALSYLNTYYGVCEPKTAVVVPGWKYEVALAHAGTSLSDGPDYDYTLMLEGSSPSNVVVEDSHSLFGVDETSTAFAGKGKSASLSVHAVAQVSVCTPDDPSWLELDAGRVVLDDEELRVKIEIRPPVESISQCRQMFGETLTVRTSGTCPSGASVPIGDEAVLVTSSGRSEIRMAKTRQQLVALGLLPSGNDDGIEEMAWLDMANLNGASGQNLSDSQAFALLGCADRGQSCNDLTLTLESNPPNSIPSESYFKAAGRETVSVIYGSQVSKVKQIMNQADWFYFSGHGNHATGTIQGGFTPSMAANHWNRDLDCVIIAGCAVLDVRNYRFNSLGLLYRWKHRSWKGACPGELWEEAGVKYLLGYALKAPLDTDGGSAIASAFTANIKSGKNIITSWRDANDNAKGRNACVIDCSKTPHEFWYWNESSGNPIWTKATKGTMSW